MSSRLASLVILLGLLGCTSIPKGRSAVDKVDIAGTSGVDSSDAEEKLATATTPKFLGLFRGVLYDYELLDRYVLQRDLARLERFYRARGYYEAHARAGRVQQISDNHVRVELVVEEGNPTTVRDVTFIGLEGLPEEVITAIRRAVRRPLRKSKPFDEEKYTEAEEAVKRALTDNGYAYATVERDATIDVVAHTADVTFTVTPGVRARFGKVTIEGLGELPEDRVRRTLDIHEGDGYSTSELDSAQQALLDLQVFSSVEMIPDLGTDAPEQNQKPIVDLKVKVQPSKLRVIKLGGGIEFDAVKTDVHGLIGWESHNFFGGLRTFSVQFRPGLVFYPVRVNNFVTPTHFLPVEKLRVELRQPSFLEARTNGFIQPEFNVIPFLVPNPPEPLPNTPVPPVLGFVEPKTSVGLDRQLWKLFGSISYNFQVEAPFTYVGELDSALRTLVISYPQLVTNLDLRDDRIRPHSGLYLGNDLQVAGGPFGGHPTDVKVQPEIRGYVPVTRKITLAMRTSVGFLFPLNYGDIMENHIRDDLTPDNRNDRTREFQIMYFRGFFAGGPNSNRGYPLRGIAPHAFVPFLNPELGAQQLANNCDPTKTVCTSSVGGLSLWEASVELRFPVGGPISSAIFCDAADVAPKRFFLRFDRPHVSCGIGARYDTPVGPIRLDLGYRLPGLQVLHDLDDKEQREEGDPGELFGVLPLGIAFGIGESF